MTDDLAARAEAAAKEIRTAHDRRSLCWKSDDCHKRATTLESLAAEIRRLQAEEAAMREALSRESLQCVIHHVGSEPSVCETHKESVPCWVQRALASNAGADFLAERERLLKRLEDTEFNSNAFEHQLWCGEPPVVIDCTNPPELGECSSHRQRRLEKRLEAAEKVCEEAAVMTGLPSQMRQAIKAWRALKETKE